MSTQVITPRLDVEYAQEDDWTLSASVEDQAGDLLPLSDPGWSATFIIKRSSSHPAVLFTATSADGDITFDEQVMEALVGDQLQVVTCNVHILIAMDTPLPSQILWHRLRLVNPAGRQITAWVGDWNVLG